jgi:hypothetical protein
MKGEDLLIEVVKLRLFVEATSILFTIKVCLVNKLKKGFTFLIGVTLKGFTFLIGVTV